MPKQERTVTPGEIAIHLEERIDIVPEKNASFGVHVQV